MPAFPTVPQGPSTFSIAVPVTRSDTVDLPIPAAALFVAVAGTVSAINTDGTTLADTGSLTAGTILPFRVQRVRLTGTSATVYALY
jgi:hypothetical protein